MTREEEIGMYAKLVCKEAACVQTAVKSLDLTDFTELTDLQKIIVTMKIGILTAHLESLSLFFKVNQE